MENCGAPEPPPRPSFLLSTSTSDLTLEERNAQALADYLERVELQKQLAIAQVQVEKQQEIDVLQRQLLRAVQQQQSATALTMGLSQSNNNYHHHQQREQLLDLSKQQLMDRVLFYQTYMQQYMWEAEQEKRRAVQQANEEAQKKWVESMAGALPPVKGSTSSAVSLRTSPFLQQQPATTTVAVSPLYAARRARIVQHSTDATTWTPLRWGPMEVQRVRGEARPIGVPAVAGPVRPAAPPVVLTRVDVTEADHGLSSQGAVGGPTLTERVSFGPETGRVSWTLDPTRRTTVPAGASSLYQQRNAKIVAQASNERGSSSSRWGVMEIQKLQGVANPVVPRATAASSSLTAAAPATPIVEQPDPRIEAADHGLRADGGVGGPTLADRVNVGAQLLLRTLDATTTAANNLYTQRNAKIVAAAGQDLVRWGDMEVQRLRGVENPAVPRATAAGGVVVSTGMTNMPVMINGAKDEQESVIEKADHGLRADGGVGGPTLAQRLTGGAGIASGATGTTSTTSTGNNLYYAQRNEKVLQAGSASRWGEQERQRLQDGPKPPTVESAAPLEHGFVNIGATLVTTTSTSKSPGALPSTIVTMDSTIKSPISVGQPASATMNASSRIVSTSSTQEMLYTKRNANLIRAAQAGSSRWGSQEIERVQSLGQKLTSTPAAAGGATTTTSSSTSKPPVKQDNKIPNVPFSIVTLNEALSAPAPTAPKNRVLPFTIASLSEVLSSAGNVNIPSEVRAADHGMRADGGVGGLTLAERVAVGAQTSTAPSGNTATATSLPSQQLEVRPYNQRNIKVMEAAKAGQSRWGALEVQRVQKTMLVEPAADAVSSGNVWTSPQTSGMQERVNLGANLIRSASSQ